MSGWARRRAPAPSEHAEQAALIEWYRAQYPQFARRLAAIPNGGWRNKITAAMLKAEGVMPGMPDLVLAIAVKPWHGLFIEMKRQGGRESPAQQLMRGELESGGYCVRVCHGFEEGRAAIAGYLSRGGGTAPAWKNWTGD